MGSFLSSTRRVSRTMAKAGSDISILLLLASVISLSTGTGRQIQKSPLLDSLFGESVESEVEARFDFGGKNDNQHLYPVCTPDLEGKVCKRDDGCPSDCRENGQQHCETIREERCIKYSRQSCYGGSCKFFPAKYQWTTFKTECKPPRDVTSCSSCECKPVNYCVFCPSSSSSSSSLFTSSTSGADKEDALLAIIVEAKKKNSETLEF